MTIWQRVKTADNIRSPVAATCNSDIDLLSRHIFKLPFVCNNPFPDLWPVPDNVFGKKPSGLGLYHLD
jgi:hypothetical protein